MLHLLLDILRNSILITGLVIVMMMLIEALDLESRGSFFGGLKKSRPGQVVLSSLLGLIPGCIGGFAAVSLYTGGILSFGALTAMMVASCGDEAASTAWTPPSPSMHSASPAASPSLPPVLNPRIPPAVREGDDAACPDMKGIFFMLSV